MTNQERIDEILAKISMGKLGESKFRVYYKNFERAPSFGKFVNSADRNELLDKGFVRFVSDSKEWEYDCLVKEGLIVSSLNHTRMLSLSELQDVRMF